MRTPLSTAATARGRRRALLAPLCALAACLFALAAPAARAEGDDGNSYERWYTVEIAGGRAGHVFEREYTDDQGRTVSESAMKMTFARGELVLIDISLEDRFVETADGKPVSMWTRGNLGGGPSETEYLFQEDGVLVRTKEAGRETTKKEAAPGGTWLTPSAAKRFIDKRLQAGAESIAFVTLEPMYGLTPVATKLTVEGVTTVEIRGKTVPATKCTMTQSIAPGVPATIYVDEHGHDLQIVSNIGAFTMTVTAAEKEEALADFEAPELMASTLVKPEGGVVPDDEARTASYLLEVSEGELPDLPTAASQRFERLSETSARVRIDLDNPPLAPPEDAENPAYIEASDAADSDDPVIRELVEKALDGVAEAPRVQAFAIVKFVGEYVKDKSFGVAFASASEVARSRSGDCSEHGVLLVAMLRAAGIPARAVSGLVYVDEFLNEDAVFGYHMWAQALLDTDGGKHWQDLDGALAMDCTHIAITTSSLADDETLNTLIPLAQIIGNLSITVEQPEHAPATAPE